MEEFLKEFSIDLNEVCSDVIMYQPEGGAYVNKSTGKAGNLIDVICRGRRFVIISEGAMGYYITHDKEHDALIIIYAVYENGWKEMKRYMFTYDRENMSVNFFPKGQEFLSMPLVDICGQASVTKCSNKIQSIVQHIVNNSCCAGAAEAAISFFGYTLKHSDSLFESGRMFTLHTLSTGPYYDVMPGDVQVYGFGSISMEEAQKWPIPKKAEEMIRKFGIMWLESKNKRYSGTVEPPEVCCIQRDKDTIWNRVFRISIAPRYPAKDSNIMFYESRREIIKEGLYNFSDLDVLYVDDMKGTFLEHIAYIMEGFASMLDKEDETRGLDEVEIDFFTRFSIESRFAFKMAKSLAESPVCEMLFNYNGEASDAIKYTLYDMFNPGGFNDEILEEVVGELQDGKTLHEALGVPKCTLSFIPEDGWLGGIKAMKDIFSTKEQREYLMRMNRDDVRKLYVFLSEAHDHLFKSNAVDILKMLFLLHGHANWKGYIHQIKKLSDDYKHSMPLLDYREYLLLLLGIGEAGKNAEWKLSGEAFEKTYKSFTNVYKFSKDEKITKASNTVLAMQETEMKALSYEGDGYIVTYPKNTDDIIMEGTCLKHCAKDFIAYLYRRSSMLLFIRKREKPDKPFYTLEIKNGTIRQCHGFDNCNIDKEEGLKEFLMEYCKGKDIVFSEGERLLGAND